MLNIVVFCMPPPALPPLSICWAKSLPERNLLEENRLPKDFNALQKSRNCHHHQLVYLLSICQANILFMSILSSANQDQNKDLVLCRWWSIFRCSPVWRIVTDRSAVTEKRWSIRKYHICHHFNFLLLVLPFSQYILAMYHDSLVKLLCAHGNHGRSERVVEGAGRVGGSSWRGRGGAWGNYSSRVFALIASATLNCNCSRQINLVQQLLIKTKLRIFSQYEHFSWGRG